jgi:hypothetical protein
MKLYTEEQVRTAIRDAYWCCSKLEVECVFDKLTPIVLPSDEEIHDRSYSDEQEKGFRNGAKWMRDKIQGGNNEQQ